MSNPIGWTDQTWNPITGCSAISPGCTNCYAERMSHRLAGRYGYPADEPFRVTLHPERLDEPLRWRKPRRVFVVSMGDLFHEDVPDEFIARVFATIGYASWANYEHTFQILTKRPERMREFLRGLNDREDWYEFMEELGFEWAEDLWNIAPRDIPVTMPEDPKWPLPNVWLGTTAEDQQRADERIPILLDTPAALRFVSCEPLLGPITLHRKINEYSWLAHMGTDGRNDWPMPGLDWVIAGAETGPGARPADSAWFRSLRDQCREAAGVPFYLKDHPGTIDGVAYREFPKGAS